MNKAEEICKQLHIDYSEILNIYPYGSKIYGTDTIESDEDYVIIYKRSLLPSGAFKDNAITSDDWKIQGTCYSRGGFIDAINNYQINALECIFLPEEKIIQEKLKFSLKKFDDKTFVKEIIKTASNSWYLGKLSYKNGDIDIAKKALFHVIRILKFGDQIKSTGEIFNYGAANVFKEKIDNDSNFKYKNYNDTFINLCNILKK